MRGATPCVSSRARHTLRGALIISLGSLLSCAEAEVVSSFELAGGTASGQGVAGEPTEMRPTEMRPTEMRPTEMRPTEMTPSGGEPAGGEPVSGVTAGEPAGGEPMSGVMGGEPVGGEPVGGEPVGGEPVGGEPEPEPLNPCANARVTAELGLRLRPQPNTSQAQVGFLPFGAVVPVLSLVEGENIEGITRWLQVTFQQVTGFISARFAECLPEQPQGEVIDDGLFYLPLACGSRARISQGNNGTTSHTNRTQYAFDFALGLNTPVMAMRAGRVLLIQDSTGPGDPCYNGGDSSCSAQANFVILLHSDGTRSSYLHLNRVDVSVGMEVSRGHQLGLSGSTGYSTGPHLHAERQESCGNSTRYCQTLPLSFADVEGDGVPTRDEWVNAAACP